MTKHVVVTPAERVEDLPFMPPVNAPKSRRKTDSKPDIASLGAEFDRLYAEWRPLAWAADEAHDKWQEAVRNKGIHPDKDKGTFWALEKEVRAGAVERANAVLDRLDEVSQAIRAIPANSFGDIAAKMRVVRLLLGIYDEEPRNNQDWDHRAMNELCDELEQLGGARLDPNERMTILAKEFKAAAMAANPDVTEWTLWEGKGASGNTDIYFTLVGKRKAGA